MPYKSEKCKIEGTQYDRRIKLSKDDKETIVKLSAEGESQRSLARMFGVSRRLIQFIIDPSKMEANRERLKKMRYVDRNHTKAMRECRRYKQRLYLEGKIQLGS